MKGIKAALTVKGVDTYFVPPFWIDVKNVYLIPVEVAQVERKKKLNELEKYKVPFELLPPDKNNKANPIFRRLKLRYAPDKNYVIVSDIDMQDKN